MAMARERVAREGVERVPRAYANSRAASRSKANIKLSIPSALHCIDRETVARLSLYFVFMLLVEQNIALANPYDDTLKRIYF
jgi:hypothetical protein